MNETSTRTDTDSLADLDFDPLCQIKWGVTKEDAVSICGPDKATWWIRVINPQHRMVSGPCCEECKESLTLSNSIVLEVKPL